MEGEARESRASRAERQESQGRRYAREKGRVERARPALGVSRRRGQKLGGRGGRGDGEEEEGRKQRLPGACGQRKWTATRSGR